MEDINIMFEETILKKHNLILQAISFVLKLILFIWKTCFLYLHFLCGCFQIVNLFLYLLYVHFNYLDNFGSVLKLTNLPNNIIIVDVVV